MAAPKNNKFAIGNSGREKMFTDLLHLASEIASYFDWCDENPLIEQQWVGKEGIEVHKKTQRPYTIEGLCNVLNCSRQTLLNYQRQEGYEEFFDIIICAKRKITDQYVTFSLGGAYNANLAKFLLTNNSEYKEKTEVENTNINYNTEVTKEEAKAISDALENEC
ncbi:MAG TPA: terminase small subunit [Candidatus Paceibacterota bacterium]